MYERFSDAARKAMQLANQEAQRFNQDIDTLHLLCGLLRDETGGAGVLIRHLPGSSAVALAVVRRRLKEYEGEDRVLLGKIPQSPEVVGALRIAVREAARNGAEWVGSEHLLLALAGLTGDPAAGFLKQFGLEPDALRDHWWAIDVELPSAVEVADEIRTHLDQLPAWSCWNTIEVTDEAIRVLSEAAPLANVGGSTRSERARALLDELGGRLRHALEELDDTLRERDLCVTLTILPEEVFYFVRSSLEIAPGGQSGRRDA